MTINFMTCNEPTNRINKSPTLNLSLTGTLKEDTSITDPVIMIESAALPAGNYAYIPEFSRYYYITDIVSERTNLWTVKLHVDVLKTYEAAIMSAPCIIAKTASNDFNLYLPDPNFKCQQNERIGFVNFPNGFSTENSHFYMTFFG